MLLLRSPRLSTAAFALAFLASFVLTAHAAIPTLDWEPTVVVDAPVMGVSSSSGGSIEYWNDSAWITYVKAGEIYVAEQAGGVWQSPVRISNDPADSRNPRLQEMGSDLVAVWEDDRTGQVEVWSRIYDGVSWTAEACLSLDFPDPSRNPVLASDGELGLVAWEEGTSPSRIDGRWWENNAFTSTTTLASGSSDLLEPAIAIASDTPSPDYAHLAWTDRRHGQEEIYYRWVTLSAVGPEVRVTNLAGPCRHPAISASRCCGGVLTRVAAIAFENTGVSGSSEVWSARVLFGDTATDVQRWSEDDAIPSVRPSADPVYWAGNPIPYCMGGEIDLAPRRFVAWTDLVGAGANRHLLAQSSDYLATEILGLDELSVTGLEASVVGAQSTPVGPSAPVTAAWIELREGVPTLVARSGEVRSCHHAQVQGPMALLLSPGGSPQTSIRFADSCSGAPAGEGSLLTLQFSNPLDADLAWDPSQQHPNFSGVLDSNGEWNLSIRGGGCSQAGIAKLNCVGITHYTWQGAKSPDIDGDCAVRDDDVEYVQSKLGTNDFCADLDESGMVDAADVAIVQATLGDACSFVVDADDPTPATNAFLVRTAPNPSAGPVQIALWASPGSQVSVSIYDASGRLVADLGRHGLASGREVLRWDGVDSRGRAVPSGIYFASLRSEGMSTRSPISILR